MKKNIMLLVFILVFLIIPNIVLSVEIIRCKSDDTNWLCEEGEICVCKISGECTDGNLLVYEGSIENLLCLPEIDDDEAVIDWDDCENPLEWVDVRADCEEGQSEEESIYFKEIIITETTTSTTTTTITTIGTTTIEEELEPCPIDWECCEGELYYEDEPCPIDMECIDHVCVPYEEVEEEGFNYGLIAGIIVVIIVVFLIYSFFIKKRGKMSFKKLYEKWT